MFYIQVSFTKVVLVWNVITCSCLAEKDLKINGLRIAPLGGKGELSMITTFELLSSSPIVASIGLE